MAGKKVKTEVKENNEKVEKVEKTEKNEKPTITRAAKTDAAKKLIRTLLAKSDFKSNDLIDEGAKLYAQQFDGEETPNSVKGRIGSVIDVMKKDGEIIFDGGMYALKKEEEKAEKPKKTTRAKAKTTDKTSETVATESVEKKAEKPKKTRAVKGAKTDKAEESVEKPKATKKEKTEKTEAVEKAETVKEEGKALKGKTKKQPLPASPLQPIAPVAPITPESAPQPIPVDVPKKRGRKPKNAQKEDTVAGVTEEKSIETGVKAEEKPVAETKKVEEKPADKQEEKQEEKKEPVKANVVDMSFLLGGVKAVKKELPTREEPKRIAQKAESLVSTSVKTDEKPTEKKTEKAQPQRREQPQKTANVKTLKKERVTVRKPTRALTADEKLKEAFLKRLHTLGGDYFEYYSVYLLEKYSRMNGRRLEGLKICGGDHDGGIDGEIEVTDRLGFRETIYIQAKNWDPDKGNERLWVVGETLLQQFIGACVCRQAKDNKQHCRGIFITTSRFTAEAKKILEDTSDKFVGYDGNDLYETAKECAFGLVKKNGEWALDEELLSGEKAFFTMR